MSTKRVLGIDPGTGICGFGVVQYVTHKQPRMVTAGVITTPAHTPVADRLLDIFESLNQIIDETHPDEVSIEKLYFNHNHNSGNEAVKSLSTGKDLKNKNLSEL